MFVCLFVREINGRLRGNKRFLILFVRSSQITLPFLRPVITWHLKITWYALPTKCTCSARIPTACQDIFEFVLFEETFVSYGVLCIAGLGKPIFIFHWLPGQKFLGKY